MEANEIKRDFPQDFQDLPDNDLIGYFFGSRQGDLKNFRISAKKVADSLGIISLGGAPIYFEGNQLPSLDNTNEPLKKGNWVNLTAGETYLNINGGPDIETPIARWSIGAFNGLTWSLKDMGELPAVPVDGVVSKDNPDAVSGGEVYEKTLVKNVVLNLKNKFNLNEVITGKFISNTTGNIGNTTSPVGAVSPLIDLALDPSVAPEDLELADFITVSGVNTLAVPNLRFVTEALTPVKPQDINGVEYADYKVGTPNSVNKTYKRPATARYVQFQVRWGDVFDYSNIQVEFGTVQTAFEPYGEGTIKEKFLPSSVIDNPYGKLRVFKTGNNVYLASKYDDNELLRGFQIRPNSVMDSNSSINLITETINGEIVKYSNDDISPSFVNGSYIGGNHGWAVHPKVVTKSAHGKTYSDIGSIYSDSVAEDFTIIKINDVNKFTVISNNKALDGSYSFLNPNGTLTHKSGGVNTASVTGYTFANEENLYNMTYSNKAKFLLDGKQDLTSNDNLCDFLEVVDNYDVLDLADLASKIIANKPVGGYTSNPQYNSLGVDKLFNHSITYRCFSDGRMSIYHSFFNYKILPTYRFTSFYQMMPLIATSKIYIPKTKPFVSGARTWNLSLVEDYTNPATQIRLSPTYWEASDKAPDRVFNFTPTMGLHFGYIKDKGIGVNRESRLYEALYINTGTRKIYPFGVSYQNPTSVPANTLFSCVMFRNIYKIDSYNATVFDYAKIGNEVYVYCDYHKSGYDEFEITEDMKGRDIEMIEQTPNVTLLNTVSDSTLRVRSTVASGGYGYIVFKLK